MVKKNLKTRTKVHRHNLLQTGLMIQYISTLSDKHQYVMYTAPAISSMFPSSQIAISGADRCSRGTQDNKGGRTFF